VEITGDSSLSCDSQASVTLGRTLRATAPYSAVPAQGGVGTSGGAGQTGIPTAIDRSLTGSCARLTASTDSISMLDIDSSGREKQTHRATFGRLRRSAACGRWLLPTARAHRTRERERRLLFSVSRQILSSRHPPLRVGRGTEMQRISAHKVRTVVSMLAAALICSAPVGAAPANPRADAALRRMESAAGTTAPSDALTSQRLRLVRARRIGR
jgi:hypothetical protein